MRTTKTAHTLSPGNNTTICNVREYVNMLSTKEFRSSKSSTVRGCGRKGEDAGWIPRLLHAWGPTSAASQRPCLSGAISLARCRRIPGDNPRTAWCCRATTPGVWCLHFTISLQTPLVFRHLTARPVRWPGARHHFPLFMDGQKSYVHME